MQEVVETISILARELRVGDLVRSDFSSTTYEILEVTVEPKRVLVTLQHLDETEFEPNQKVLVIREEALL